MRRLALLVVVLSGACSTQTDAADDAVGATTPTSVVEATVSVENTTTVAAAPSTALITIGPARYELGAVCSAGGADELEVSVGGFDVNGLPVVGYIRAFHGEPYVSLQVGTGAEAVLFEPRLDGILPFEITEQGVRFEEVDFVTELDLDTGEFVPAGVGSAEVECRSFVRELPPVVFG